MRDLFSSLALGTVLVVGLSGNALLAQDQSAPRQPLHSRRHSNRPMFLTPAISKKRWRKNSALPRSNVKDRADTGRP